MNSLSDPELLRDYSRNRSEAAFAELVRRHIDLVYSAARRMVRDAHLAEDVTQGVFVALAQNARQLADRPVLSGWLHGTTQNLAVKLIRTDVRRRAREQEAAAMNELFATESEGVWEQIAPHLDAALGALSEPDRDALMLRYFERKSAQEMGQVLGVSDEAAQKRVSRAVERLREFFVQRGVTIRASGLVVLIAANAVQAAPVGLALTISTTAVLSGTALATSATATVTKAIAMTATQKIVVTTALAAALGTGFYQRHQATTLRNQIESLQQQQTSLRGEIQQLTQERDDFTNQLAAARAALLAGLPQRGTDNAELIRLRNEVGLLRGQIAAIRGGRIEPAAIQTVSTVAPTPNGEEEMRQLGLAASRGDISALQKLDELSQIASKGRTNVNQDTHREIRVAFKVMGEEAGKGNETAFQVLYRATRMRFLEGMAVYALGDAAAAGNERALEVLLDPKRFLLNSSPTGPLVAAAKSGNVRAVEYLAAIANDPKKQGEWFMATTGLEGPAAAGNATAIDALAVIGRSEHETLRKGALRALENAAFNNQPRATEALRSLGYQ